MSPQQRLSKIEQRVETETRPKPGLAVVHCDGEGRWDALPAAEREARIAAELGRPSQADDLVIVLERRNDGPQ